MYKESGEAVLRDLPISTAAADAYFFGFRSNAAELMQ